MARTRCTITVPVEPDLYRYLKHAAARERTSISATARELLRVAMNTEEDRFWSSEGEERLRSFRRRSALRHGQVWR